MIFETAMKLILSKCRLMDSPPKIDSYVGNNPSDGSRWSGLSSLSLFKMCKELPEHPAVRRGAFIFTLSGTTSGAISVLL
jgi:hypothetical protein